MNPVAALVADKLKEIAKSSNDLMTDMLLQWRQNTNRRNPIEILKRLQQEAFSDLMKLRNRQDKVERLLSFSKISKGSPFQESSTHVKGEVDVVGSIVFSNYTDQDNGNTLTRAGIRTGVDSRFTFETIVRETNALVAELAVNHNSQGYFDDAVGSPLSLAKVMYMANVTDWFSAVVTPVGAQCKDFTTASNALNQERSLTEVFSHGPPIMRQINSSGAGLVVKRSNITASLAGFISGVRVQQDYVGIRHCFSTFGQIIYHISKGTKFSLLGIHKKLNRPGQQLRLWKFAVPIGGLTCHQDPNASLNVTDLANAHYSVENMAGSIALMAETELDRSRKIEGWLEMQGTSPRSTQWAVTMSDSPVDELGWGLSLGGTIQRPSNHFQVEAFLKLNMSEQFSLQPGLVYVMNGSTHIPALMFRSSWSL